MKIEKLEEMWMWCSTDDIDNRFDSINFADIAQEYMPKLIAVAKAARKTQRQSTQFPGDAILELQQALAELEGE